MDGTLAAIAHVARVGVQFGTEFLPPPFNAIAREAIEQLTAESNRTGQSIEEIMAHAEQQYPLTIGKIDDFQRRLEADAARSVK